MLNKKSCKIAVIMVGVVAFFSLILLQLCTNIVKNQFKLVFAIMYILTVLGYVYFTKYTTKKSDYLSVANKTVLKFMLVVSTVSCAGLLSDINFGKTSSMSFVCIVLAMMLACYVISVLSFFYNEKNTKFRYIILVEFIIMYMIFISVGTYWMYFSSIAMLVIFTVYGDRKFNFIVGMLVTILIFISIPFQMKNVIEKDKTLYIMWMFLVIFIICFIIVVCTVSSSSLINMIAKDKLEKVEQQQVLTENVSKEAMKIGNNIKEDTNSTTLVMKELDEAAINSIKIFDKVLEDNEKNVESTKVQNGMIINITNMLEETKKRIDAATTMIDYTYGSLTRSIETVNDVKIKSQGIIKINNKVEQSYNEFKKSIDKLKGFTISIEEIVNQIDLLSINAGIESQRNNVYSKEFSLVANEIQTLAEGTYTFVNQIKSTIYMLEKDIRKIGKTIYKVDETTKYEDTIVLNNINRLNEMSKNIINLKCNVEDSLKKIYDIVDYLNHVERLTSALYKDSESTKEKTSKIVKNNKENISNIVKVKDLVEFMDKNAGALIMIDKQKLGGKDSV